MGNVCAPLSRGHRVFFAALRAPSLLLSPLDGRCFEDAPSHANTHPRVAQNPPLTEASCAENEKPNLKFSADEDGVHFPRPYELSTDLK